MKRILLTVLLLLILTSCESNINEKNDIENNNQEIDLNKNEIANSELDDDFVDELGSEWFIGKIDNQGEIRLRYEIIEGKFYGEYFLDKSNEMISLKGDLVDNVYFVSGTDGCNFIISLKVEDKILGIIEKENEYFSFYGLRENTENLIPKLDLDEIISLGDTYINEAATMFTESSIKITPVFNELIYVEIFAQNGTHTGQVNFFAYEEQNEFIGDIEDLEFRIQLLGKGKIKLVTDRISRAYNCGSNVSYGDFYSNNVIAEVYDGIKLGLAEDEYGLNNIKNLVGGNYENILYFSQYHIKENVNGYESTTFSIVGYPDTYKIMKKDGYIYIALTRDITNFERGVIYTNNTGNIPYEIEEFLSFDYDLNKQMKTKLESSVNLIGESIDDFILDGWEIKDKIVGSLNDDELEDVVLVIDKLEFNDIEKNRLLLLLINNGSGYDLLLTSETALFGKNDGGVWGDLYDYINLEDGNLIISFYGGSNYRWGYTYTFDISRNFQLVEIFELEHSTISLEVTEKTINLIKNSITIVKYDSDENKTEEEYKKGFVEFIYLIEFNILNNVDNE